VFNDESWENGYHSVLQGTTQSINTIYMGMAEQLNLCEIHNVAKAMGIDSADPQNPKYAWQTVPASAIGGANLVSPLQVAQAYAAFANGGISCTPIVIDSISRVDDGSAVAVPKTTCKQAIPKDVADAVLYALKTVMTYGTGTQGNPWDGTPIAGKTGTAGSSDQGSTQNWLATTTSKVAQVTWVGNVNGLAALRKQWFTNADTGQVINGGDAKLIIAKPIIKALDATYGGTDFDAPPRSLLYGANYQPPVQAPPSSTPTAPASSDKPTANPKPTQPAKPNGSTKPPAQQQGSTPKKTP
jgi:membrane peptidoglycan carboxypeptidase